MPIIMRTSLPIRMPNIRLVRAIGPVIRPMSVHSFAGCPDYMNMITPSTMIRTLTIRLCL